MGKVQWGEVQAAQEVPQPPGEACLVVGDYWPHLVDEGACHRGPVHLEVVEPLHREVPLHPEEWPLLHEGQPRACGELLQQEEHQPRGVDRQCALLWGQHLQAEGPHRA